MADASKVADLVSPDPAQFYKQENIQSSEFLWINDINNNQYNAGQIQIDTTGTTAVTSWVDWKSSYIMLPMTVTATVGAGNGYSSSHALALKNTYFSLVDSINGQLGTSTFSNNSPLAGVLSAFRMQCELTPAKLKTYGALVYFAPDTPILGSLAPWGTNSGVNHFNTRDLYQSTDFTFAGANATAAGAYPPGGAQDSINAGFRQRGAWLCNGTFYETGPIDPTHPDAPVYTPNAVQHGAAATMGINHTDMIAAAAGLGAGTYHYYIYAFLPMRYLHHLFERLPIVRGLRVWMQLQINQTSIAVAAAANTTAVTLTSGRSNPLMLGSSGMALAAAYGAGITQAVLAITGPARLYFRTLRFNPLFEAQLGNIPRRTVKYYDHLLYTLPNNAGNSSVNWSIANGVRSVRKLILFNYASSQGVAAADGQSSYLACKSGEPMCCTPGTLFTSVQLLVGGQQFHSNIENYSLEQWKQDFTTCFLNGDADMMLTSGMIGYDDYALGAAPLVFDFTKSPYANLSDNSPVTLQLIAQLTQPYFAAGARPSFNVDLVAFVIVERSVDIEQNIGSASVVNAA